MKTDNYTFAGGVVSRHQAADDLHPDLQGQDDEKLSNTILRILHRSAEQGFALPVYDLPQITGFTLSECFGGVRKLEFERLARIEDDPTDPFGARLILLDDGTAEASRR